MKEEKTYIMGSNWLKRFLSTKKRNDGWTSEDLGNNQYIIRDNNGSIFAKYDQKNGLVHTKRNVSEVQW